MLQRERQRQASRERAAGEPDGPGCDAARQEAHAYYNAVDSAISHALSIDSVEFNRQVQQENGQ